jgi:hypothetical protein
LDCGSHLAPGCHGNGSDRRMNDRVSLARAIRPVQLARVGWFAPPR